MQLNDQNTHLLTHIKNQDDKIEILTSIVRDLQVGKNKIISMMENSIIHKIINNDNLTMESFIIIIIMIMIIVLIIVIVIIIYAR
jgi:hypothetical protein